MFISRRRHVGTRQRIEQPAGTRVRPGKHLTDRPLWVDRDGSVTATLVILTAAIILASALGVGIVWLVGATLMR